MEDKKKINLQTQNIYNQYGENSPNKNSYKECIRCFVHQGIFAHCVTFPNKDKLKKHILQKFFGQPDETIMIQNLYFSNQNTKAH